MDAPNTAHQTRQLWYTREVDFYDCCWMKKNVVSNPIMMLSNSAVTDYCAQPTMWADRMERV